VADLRNVGVHATEFCRVDCYQAYLQLHAQAPELRFSNARLSIAVIASISASKRKTAVPDNESKEFENEKADSFRHLCGGAERM
jgi:hypothetical protein